MSRHLTPCLATALFRRYLRSCIPTSPHRIVPPPGEHPEAGLDTARRFGHRHHH
ncbi:hypothetical protein [Streptomyces griseiscabiei]|uniref:Uncharacterized protein n=1 Tax=Streptomyces griseiscabiei TaxID=2993540 RepID=A0ABU4KYU5_9ACTN|nr:hypothetical protein [Streptomyces griseiscabiei]MBZ3904422.1 hypothetical protein [Streptomyces griseiscabiei]MDX2908169.1 hypothetical protein [Streptomyces griseiscabiei]